MPSPRNLLIASFLAFVSQGTARGQSGPVEYFGYYGPEWVVLPELARQGSEWSQIWRLTGRTEPTGWEEPSSYYFRNTTTGESGELRSGEVIRVCCDNIGNPVWALSTDRTSRELPNYVRGTDGYVVSDPSSDAPFLPLPMESTPPPILEMMDSVSTLPDSVPTQLGTVFWRAQLGAEVHTFFQVTESGVGRYVGCFIAVGWLLHGERDEVVPVSWGWDDCENKGHAERRPLALLRRGGDLLMIIAFFGWDGGPTKVWRHIEGTDWEVVFDPSGESAAGDKVGTPAR